MRKPGTIEPVFYFSNGTDPAHEPGYVMLAPYTGGGDRCSCPTPEGYRLEYADTLPDVDKLERRLQEQCRREFEAEGLREETKFAGRREAIRERILRHISSSDLDEYNKEFLRLWIQLSDERKRKMYAQRFLERETFLWARHNDIGKRDAGEESFKPERHTVKS